MRESEIGADDKASKDVSDLARRQTATSRYPVHALHHFQKKSTPSFPKTTTDFVFMSEVIMFYKITRNPVFIAVIVVGTARPAPVDPAAQQSIETPDQVVAGP